MGQPDTAPSGLPVSMSVFVESDCLSECAVCGDVPLFDSPPVLAGDINFRNEWHFSERLSFGQVNSVAFDLATVSNNALGVCQWESPSQLLLSSSGHLTHSPFWSRCIAE